MSHCFTYGSLMCQEIMNQVCGASFDSVNAKVFGFSRHCVQGEHYPGMVACSEVSAVSLVEGMLYLNVSPMALKRLDDFEGDMYHRQTVEVLIDDGSKVFAQTYVIRPEFIHVLDDKAWSFEHFLKYGKADFQEAYQGYQSIES